MPIRHGNTHRAFGWLIALLVLLPSALSAPQEIKETSPLVVHGKGAAIEAPPPEGKAAEATAEYKTPAAKTLPPAPRVENHRPAEPACDARCQESEQREKADLKAQQSMATAAKELVVITWWQFWAGVVGVSLLFATLYLTRQATKAAIRSAEYAQEAVKTAEGAVEESKKTTVRQLRAYMSSAEPIDLRLEGNGIARARVTMKNAGQTPAKQFSMWTAITVLDHPYVGVLIAVPPPRTKMSQTSIRPQGSATGSHTITVSPDDKAAIARGKKAIYVSGCATYVDVFGTNQTSNFRFMYHGPWEGVQRLDVCPDGNEET